MGEEEREQEQVKADSVVGVCCSSSSSPVTVGLHPDSPLLLAESSHGRIGVSHASSVATRSLFYPSFSKTNSPLCIAPHICYPSI